MGHLLDHLNNIRDIIAADEDILRATRHRRDSVTGTAVAYEGVLRRFASGSVAHGTVNDPVNDADGGIVLDRRSFPELGPDGQGEGPATVVEKLRKRASEKLQDEYSDVEVGTSKRGLEVKFNAPIKGQDPTVDSIVTLTRKDDAGLWIPNLETDDWDASDPERHTELFTSGSRELRALRARITRLAKAWNKQWAIGDRAFSSFNLEALAWEFVDDEDAALDEAIVAFFRYARDSVETGDTQDPAEVSEDIGLLLSREIAVKRLAGAAGQLDRALCHDDDEDVVLDALASVFRDYVDALDGSRSALAQLLSNGNAGVTVTPTGIGVGNEAGRRLKTTSAYGGLRA